MHGKGLEAMGERGTIMNSIEDKLIIIRGGGDVATGTAHRLKRCGFSVVILEVSKPTVIRRWVAFANAVYEGEMIVEGIRARLHHDTGMALEAAKSDEIPVLIDPEGSCIAEIRPEAVVDCILAKKNLGTHTGMAPIVIGIGPGFAAPKDVHAVIETKRGHDLGRVIRNGTALPDTGIPGNVGGYTEERILRAGDDGIISIVRDIGQSVSKGEVICTVSGKPVEAAINGIVRGLVRNGSLVYHGMKIGDIDPRNELEYCLTISDKARAIGGGVLEAILALSAHK